MSKPDIINVLDDNLRTFLIDYNNRKEVVLSEENIENYLSLLKEHKSFEIPFIEHTYYKNLLKISKSIVQNEELESWYILDQYIELNIDSLQRDFLVEAIEGFGKIKFFKFKFWYFVENRIVQDYKSYCNLDLAKIVYSFAYAGKGSDYFYRIIAEELMRRKISKLTEEEFILIHNAYANLKIKDKIFNLLIEKARKEKFSYL